MRVEIVADLLARKPVRANPAQLCLLLDGLPVVGQEKTRKLTAVIEKLAGVSGGVHMFTGSDGQTKGYVSCCSRLVRVVPPSPSSVWLM